MKLENKKALITGASRGIGASVAKRFAQEGAEVILVARTIGALEALDDEITALGGKAVLVPLDLTDFDKIDQLGASLYERFGKLDILVGNAGTLGTLTPLTHADPAMWQKTLDINLTANWRLLRSMDYLLRQSAAGRAMFVSSSAASGAYPYWGAYGVSKAALEMLVKTYAAENSGGNIRTNLINPGAVATSMRKQAFPGENQVKLPQPDEITDIFVQLASEDCTANGEIFHA